MKNDNSPSAARFRERVRALLEDRGTSISQLARDTGLSRENLSNILNGRHNCNLATAELIADSLGSQLYELIAPENSAIGL